MKKNKKKFVIQNIEIKKAKKYRIDIDIGRMHDFTDLKMPIEILSGVNDGPTLFVCSTIHGDEINGIEIVRRLLTILDVKSIAGKLIAIPIVNVFGFNDYSRYLPDRRDLNRCFPGLKNGSLASQLAYKFMQEIVLKSDYGIDIHSGSFHRSNLPQIRIDISNKLNLELAQAFAPLAIINSNLRDGSLRSEANHANIPVILYEAGEVLRFDENAVNIGVNGILRMMNRIGMIENNFKKKYSFLKNNYNPNIFIGLSSTWIRASQSGIFISNFKLGDVVKKNQVVGNISNPFGDNNIEILASFDGLVIGINMLPLVNKGDALIHIASPKKLKEKDKFFNENNLMPFPLNK